MLSVAPEEIIRMHTSSGTTGKPTAIFHTREDVDNWAELMARCLHDGRRSPARRLPEHERLRPLHRRPRTALRRRAARDVDHPGRRGEHRAPDHAHPRLPRHRHPRDTELRHARRRANGPGGRRPPIPRDSRSRRSGPSRTPRRCASSSRTSTASRCSTATG